MTYEYVCEACGNQWEAEQSIKAAPLVKCVSCGEDKAKRLISGGTGFLLKGGGWYADLYGSPGSGAAKGEDKDKDKAAKAGGATPKTEGAESKSATAETTSSGEGKSTGGAAATGSTPTTTATPATSSAKAS